jgi:hypothetical protein
MNCYQTRTYRRSKVMSYEKKIEKASCYWDEHVKLHGESSNLIIWRDSPLVQDLLLKKLRVGDQLMSVSHWVLWPTFRIFRYKLPLYLNLYLAAYIILYIGCFISSIYVNVYTLYARGSNCPSRL